MSHTGENEQGLRKIVDLTRFASIFILLLHFYYYCYVAFEQWEIESAITDRLMQNISNTGLFYNQLTSKFMALVLLVISLFGAQGKKDEKINWKSITAYLLIL
jgi:YWFCY protein